MAFKLDTFFTDVFKPDRGEIVTVMYDLPHGEIADNAAWMERRQLAQRWREELASLAGTWGVTVSSPAVYLATGSNNADLPATCRLDDREVSLEGVLKDATIVLSMPEFSATAPLYQFAKTSDRLRVASMPGVAKFMEESGLSADYRRIARTCQNLAPVFDRAVAAEVEFSTGHNCFFDLTSGIAALKDDGILHPERAGTDDCLSNLPAGEVFAVPNENEDSKTEGELPQMIGDELVCYVVRNNRIVDVTGAGPEASKLKENFAADAGWRNIAEFAIGVNDKAKVTGNVLEDEKAGFHWAYGRSDHFGGQCGVDRFNSPENVVHQDIVYAKESPIVCARLEFIFADGTREQRVRNGQLLI